MTRKNAGDDTASKAATILTADREPDRSEQAAIEAVQQQAWVLWHADDYVAGVVRLLSRAGLLRDRAREAELAEADIVMRRLEDEDRVKRNRELNAARSEIEDLRQQLAQRGGNDGR